ncbi:MAG: hypothetical protein AABY15_09260 [Nanoarchaeota archaeon]
MSNLPMNTLLENVNYRDVATENKRLVEKWNRTGLLRGLKDQQRRETLARLLENQAAQVLRESSLLTEANALSTGAGALTSSGKVRGFSNIAFPIVRRVFGGLVANELVSVQAMSLPSGLLFYLDYTYGSAVGIDGPALGGSSSTKNTYKVGDSIYNSPSGKSVQSGSLATGGQHDLVGHGYSRVHSGSSRVGNSTGGSGIFGAWTSGSNAWASVGTDKGGVVDKSTDLTGTNASQVDFDPQVAKDLSDGTLEFVYAHVQVTDLTNAISGADALAVSQIAVTAVATGRDFAAWGEKYQGGAGVLNLRRQNKRGDWDATAKTFTSDPLNGDTIQMVFKLTGSSTNLNEIPVWAHATVAMALAPSLNVDTSDGSTLTIPSFETDFASTPSPAIPEIDIKIESIAVTAQTRKLRARWSPELAQDLNAYHSLDAEVELTQILSEQIALEVDREILSDLLMQGNGANLYWSRAPGKMVNKNTGVVQDKVSTLSPGPAFTGTVREWYETLTETIIDVANTIHRKTLRGSANFVVTSPDVCTLFESSMQYMANVSIDSNGQLGSPFTLGAVPVGKLANRFTVYKDPYFPRNKVLVGYKGGSYLETGYVYAPYVPLIVTPTIFGPDDFSPRKGVMTRYGKKMVRSDFFGVVTVMDLDII